MKKCLVFAACVGFLLLAGCNRCGMWDCYDPCDLIEGRAARNCGPSQCDPCHQPGQVVRREIAVKASDCAPTMPPPPEATVIVVEEIVVEEAAPPAN